MGIVDFKVHILVLEIDDFNQYFAGKKNHYNLQKEKIYYIACKGINLLYKFAYGEL